MDGKQALRFRAPEECLQGEWVEGEVSHQEENGVFWLQRNPDRARDLGEQLEEGVEVLTSGKEMKEGSAVVASWDGAFYRGKVLEVCGEDDLNILFVDYGNSDVVAKSMVRPAGKGELAFPPLAIRCRFLEMSSSWEDELEESNYHVRLYCVGREEEVHLMSKEASLVHDAKTASSLDSVEEASSSLQCSFSDSLSLLPLSTPLPGEAVGVRGAAKHCMLVFAPDLFLPSLDEVTSQLDALVPSKLRPLPHSLMVPGQPCAAVFSEDSRLYRALVLSTPEQGQVEISYVDYGNSEDKAVEELLTLPPELANPGPATVEVPLARQVDREVDEVEKEVVGPAQLWLEETSGRGRVAKVYKDGRELLVKRVRLEQVPGCLEPDIPLGEKLLVDLSYVENVNKVWVTRQADQPNIDKVQELLASTVNLEPLAQANPGQIAVAKCDEDSSWGRVKVEGNEGESIKVRFLDFGSVEFKRMEEIFMMPESVMEFPASAFLVSVNSKIETTDENRGRIYDLLDTGEELCVVLRSDKSGVFYIGGRQVLPDEAETEKQAAKDVLVGASNVQQADKRVEELEEVAMFVEKALELKGELEVSVTHVEKGGWVWATPVQLQEQVDDLMEELDKLRPELQPAVQCEEGDTVAAIYSEDGELYRSRIVSRSGVNLQVQFIDFGNTEEKSAKELLSLPRHLHEEVRRGLAIKVQMAGLDTSLEEEERVKLEEKLTERNVVMTKRTDGLVEFLVHGVRVELETPVNHPQVLADPVNVVDSPVRHFGSIEVKVESSGKQDFGEMISSTPVKTEVSEKLVSSGATIQQLKEQMDRELKGREMKSRPVCAMEKNQVPVARQPKGPGNNNGFTERKVVHAKDNFLGVRQSGKIEKMPIISEAAACPVMSQELLESWVEGCRRMLEKRESLMKAEKSVRTELNQWDTLLTRLEDGESGVEEVLDWLLNQDLFDICCNPASTQVVQMALKLANCNQQGMLFKKLESHFIPLASDVTGHHVIKIVFAAATSQQKKLLQSKLSNEGMLLTLLASTSGTSIVQLLAEGEAGSTSRVSLINFLLLQLSNIAVLPTALPFLQELLESEVGSGLHPLATELSSYPCLPTLLHHPTGHLLLETLVNKDLGAPTLRIARWLLRQMEEVVKCAYAASLASNVLRIILSHISDPNYCSMLTRWTDRLTSGLEPLLVEASKTGASHLFAICLVTQQAAEQERRKAVAVVRRHQQELRESIMGCLVVKAAQGWL